MVVNLRFLGVPRSLLTDRIAPYGLEVLTLTIAMKADAGNGSLLTAPQPSVIEQIPSGGQALGF
jgi:hypothetical protein